MKLKYNILEKINLYSGFFNLNKYRFIHEKHDGEWTDEIEREIFSGAHVAALLPYDPIKKKIILIQQFRAGSISRFDSDYLYEIVAGIIDEGENAEEAAKRECLEKLVVELKKLFQFKDTLLHQAQQKSTSSFFLEKLILLMGNALWDLKMKMKIF